MSGRTMGTIMFWLAAFCSITGITLLPMWKHLLRHPHVVVYALYGVGIFAVVGLGVILRRRLRESQGIIVSRDDRQDVSQNFARLTLRSLDIFAGDLSWLEEDMAIYRDLRAGKMRVRILTDAPSAATIAAGKVHGIEFRRYPGGKTAPLKASITDADEETEARALVVKRRTPRRRPQKQMLYKYWMKFYHGSSEYPVIKAMAELFDELFSRGTPL